MSDAGPLRADDRFVRRFRQDQSRFKIRRSGIDPPSGAPASATDKHANGSTSVAIPTPNPSKRLGIWPVGPDSAIPPWSRRIRWLENAMAPATTRRAAIPLFSRVVLPGAQALLGFQLAVTLTRAFEALPYSSKLVHAAALMLVALAKSLDALPASSLPAGGVDRRLPGGARRPPGRSVARRSASLCPAPHEMPVLPK